MKGILPAGRAMPKLRTHRRLDANSDTFKPDTKLCVGVVGFTLLQMHYPARQREKLFEQDLRKLSLMSVGLGLFKL